MSFDLESFLRDMRREQRDSHQALAEKVDSVDAKLATHDTRLTVLENTRKTIRWLTVTLIGGAITVALELITGFFRGGKP